MMRILLPLLLLTLPASGDDALLQVEVLEGVPCRLRIRGKADAPDRVLLDLSLTAERSDVRGESTEALRVFKVAVKDGCFDATFVLQEPLRAGTYAVTSGYDPKCQYSGVSPPSSLRLGRASFRIPFLEDISAPLPPALARLARTEQVWKELEAKFLETRERLGKGDPKAKAEWLDFLQPAKSPWPGRFSKLSEGEPPGEDPVYPRFHEALGNLRGKIAYFLEDFNALVLHGVPCISRRSNPGWFEPPPEEEMGIALALLAREFAFNVDRKVVDYGYDRATEILKAGRGWEAFRTSFGHELDRIETAASDLALKDLGPPVAAMIGAGRELLDAGDLLQADPAQGAPAMEAAKGKLKAAHAALQPAP